MPRDENGSVAEAAAPLPKWAHPNITATGETRAQVPLVNSAGRGATTLWFNTGTLCNIACSNCYIESTPRNDRLVYLTRAEVAEQLDQIAERNWPTREIGITGGEPFMNPEILGILEETLRRGYETLVLTNAMRPMMRPRVMAGLLALRDKYRDQLVLRVSLDHYTQRRHDEERGAGAFKRAWEGIAWLHGNLFALSIAGRMRWDEDDKKARDGYRRLFRRKGVGIDWKNPKRLILFPEMDEAKDPPEISTGCWDILGKSPQQIMCASSRMVVKRKGAEKPVYLACTLIAYDTAFELGSTAAEAERPVPLNHPSCATFCVLGGASCS
ncbi:MAG: radical SAM protein [Neomegalonema sp.]|nr:radical SAM protein [Neomegalonema sp.]